MAASKQAASLHEKARQPAQSAAHHLPANSPCRVERRAASSEQAKRSGERRYIVEEETNLSSPEGFLGIARSVDDVAMYSCALTLRWLKTKRLWELRNTVSHTDLAKAQQAQSGRNEMLL